MLPLIVFEDIGDQVMIVLGLVQGQYFAHMGLSCWERANKEGWVTVQEHCPVFFF